MPQSEVRDASKAAAKHRQEPRNQVYPTGPTTSQISPGPEGLSTARVDLMVGDYSQNAFQRHAELLGSSSMSQPANSGTRAAIMGKLQRDYGNFYVQRIVDHIQLTRTARVQAKLSVGPAGDKYEQEADSVAKDVMGKLRATNDTAAQRQGEEEEELQMKPVAQRQAPVGMEGGDVDRDVESTIQQAKGGGQGMPDGLRSSMEGAFGSDFSGVKLHTGSQADSLNQSMSARAFTTGQDIFFKKGEYSPNSSSGQELLAHELTHVVQQGGAARREPAGLQKADDPGESEGKMKRLGKWLRRGLSSVSSTVSSTGEVVIKGYKIIKETGANILEAAADVGTTAASAFVGAAKATGKFMYKAGVEAGIAAVDFKDAAVATATATAEKLGELAITAGNAMVDAAIAGADAVVDAAKTTKAYLKDKGILPPSIMSSDEMADTIKADRPMELLAHGLAYSYPSVKEPETLEAAGYDTSAIGATSTPDGLQYVWMKPRMDDSGKPLTDPILAFRGTATLENAISDVDPLGVGYLLFEAHTQEVQAKMAELSSITGQVYVTGHSLGGSLAQRAAKMAPGYVKRLVTFQSPGISEIPLGKLESLAGKVTHHIATGDVVDLSGGFSVPGDYIVHQIPGYNNALAHTVDLLKSDDQKMWPYEKYPWSYKLKALPNEICRVALGAALAPVVIGGRALKKYVSAAASGTAALYSYIKPFVANLFTSKATKDPEEASGD